ncbi:ABC transporter ATP-binding protein [Streptomyces sp. NPDC127066]|uniref:ABC transporter ATP-binding protein n=1 Tax=Streptomyces sp. NPDC127066 TaxID=3347125 RepID=UPI003649C698
MSAAAAVEADGLYVIYRERDLETVALRGAGISLPEGTWTSLMGPSGSGKSTLVHVLGGLLEPSGGRVLIGGEDITRLPSAERAQRRRRRIGMVLQRDNLHPLLDVGGNIALPLRLDGRPAAHVRSRVRELLDGLGLSDRARQPVGQLSGGEAQRVAIAVALAARPTVLLADEITGELDARTAAGVLDILARVRDDEGAAILTVTHNPSVTERADLCLRMRDGIVIE